MSSSRKKKGVIAILTLIFGPLLIALVYSGIKVMTSTYYMDYGNGVVIRADEYVESGKWVFNCETGALVSRQQLTFPVEELEKTGQLTIGDSFLSSADELPGKLALKAITKSRDWYRHLEYQTSWLGEDSNLSGHYFQMIAEHEGRQWVLTVFRSLPDREFEVTIEPYDPVAFKDHEQMLAEAIKGCPER